MKIGKLEVYGIIYKIVNKTNNKIYIGQTKRSFNKRYYCSGIGIERLYKYHKKKIESKLHYNKHLLESIEKYGFESFKVIEIFDIAFSEEELNIKEQCWISIYKCNIEKFGYNKTDGGQKISSNFKYGNEKPVICLNMDKVFRTIEEASRFYNAPNSGIIKCCRGNAKSCGKLKDNTLLKWMYYSDYIKEHPMKRKLICLNNNEIFDDKKAILKKYNITKNQLYKHLEGVSKCLYINEEKYFFIYLDIYFTMNEKEIIYKTSYDKIICKNTNEIFNNVKEASDKYGINIELIKSNLKGRSKSAGRINDKKAIWCYFLLN